VVEDLVELASDANSNVRKQALMIILQSIDDRGNRLLFLPTKFLKVLLNLIGDEVSHMALQLGMLHKRLIYSDPV
jgi:hypothetical protein